MSDGIKSDSGFQPMSDEQHQAAVQEALDVPAERDQLDQLFTDIRLAMDAQREAGYQYGKYIHQDGGDDVQHPIMRQAREKADELRAAMWAKMYDLAPALADAIQVLEVARALESDER